jgi:hypothetical protein
MSSLDGDDSNKDTGTKRKRQSTSTDFFLACCFCSKKFENFSLATSSPKSVASCVNTNARDHLLLDCDKVPGDIKQKLNKLSPPDDSTESERNINTLEKHAVNWNYSFQLPEISSSIAENDERRSRKVISGWRPLTWRLIHKKGAASVCAKSLAYKNSFPVPASEKPLPPGIKDDDVLVGWDSPHVGNRRFQFLLEELRPAFFDESITLAQQKMMAEFAVTKIGARGGRFFAVPASGTTKQPVFLGYVKAAIVTLTALQKGFVTVLQPPLDPSMTGRGSRVLEFEYAPQCGLFDEEIVWNKKPKKLKFEPERKAPGVL